MNITPEIQRAVDRVWNAIGHDVVDDCFVNVVREISKVCHYI